MFKQQAKWWLPIGGILLILLSLTTLNFLNFRIAKSTTEVNHTLSTYRSGERLPDNMTPGFTLSYAVSGDEQMAEALAATLQLALADQTSVGTATAVSSSPSDKQAPFLLVDLSSSDRLWTPVYGQATVKAQIYYAYDGDAPWPLDEPVVFRVSPAVKADGEFTVVDTTWGLISKPAYYEHLAQALAEDISNALQDDAFAVR
jgi:hypothetical protein